MFQGTEWLFLGALTPITYVLGRRFPITRDRWPSAVAVHFAGAALLCLGWASLGVLLGNLLGRFPADNYLSWLLTSIPWSVFMYFTVLGCVHAFAYFLEARERDAQASRLAAQLAEARLSALRMQIHPHFLFNTLNAIAVLVREHQTATATRMLELLGDMLRQVLAADRQNEVPLSTEVAFLEQYLAIEQIRFADRLQVTVDDRRHRAVRARPYLRAAAARGERGQARGHAARSWRPDHHRRACGDDRLELMVEDDGVGMREGQTERRRPEQHPRALAHAVRRSGIVQRSVRWPPAAPACSSRSLFAKVENGRESRDR